MPSSSSSSRPRSVRPWGPTHRQEPSRCQPLGLVGGQPLLTRALRPRDHLGSMLRNLHDDSPLDARVSFALHFSHRKVLALRGARWVCWHLTHLTVVAFPAGAGLGRGGRSLHSPPFQYLWPPLSAGSGYQPGLGAAPGFFDKQRTTMTPITPSRAPKGRTRRRCGSLRAQSRL
jgi:hypothetical protein